MRDEETAEMLRRLRDISDKLGGILDRLDDVTEALGELTDEDNDSDGLPRTTLKRRR